MGTNYYWSTNKKPCPTCGHNKSETIHIGKASAGWQFNFHGEAILNSYKGWFNFMARNPDGYITDEYGRRFDLSRFKAVVAGSRGGRLMSDEVMPDWYDTSTERSN